MREDVLTRCRKCGGELFFNADNTVGICSKCGNKVDLVKERKILEEEEKAAAALEAQQKAVSETYGGVEFTEEITEIFRLLREGFFGRAQEQIDALLENEPDNILGWLARLMAETETMSRENIGREIAKNLAKVYNNEKACYCIFKLDELGNDELKANLEETKQQIFLDYLEKHYLVNKEMGENFIKLEWFGSGIDLALSILNSDSPIVPKDKSSIFANIDEFAEVYNQKCLEYIDNRHSLYPNTKMSTSESFNFYKDIKEYEQIVTQPASILKKKEAIEKKIQTYLNMIEDDAEDAVETCISNRNFAVAKLWMEFLMTSFGHNDLALKKKYFLAEFAAADVSELERNVFTVPELTSNRIYELFWKEAQDEDKEELERVVGAIATKEILSHFDVPNVYGLENIFDNENDIINDNIYSARFPYASVEDKRLFNDVINRIKNKRVEREKKVIEANAYTEKKKKKKRIRNIILVILLIIVLIAVYSGLKFLGAI